MSTIQLTWSARGPRLTAYGPLVASYRNRLVWAELVHYWPAWGGATNDVWEWRLYRETIPGRAEWLDTHSPDDMYVIEAWVTRYAERASYPR